MSLKYAILGFLSLEPMSGYDLKTRWFDGSVSHFWPANQAHIYRILEKLEEEGLVTGMWEMQTERPNRREYAITPDGMADLRAWLAASRPLPKERFPFLVQLYFSRHLTKEELLAVLHDQKRLHTEKLNEYQLIDLPEAEDELLTEQLIFGEFTLDFGMRYEQMIIEWLDAVIQQVEEMA